MRKYSTTSNVWNFFEKVQSGGRCGECKKVIACFGNTSNLVKHLRRLHKSVHRELILQNQNKYKVPPDYDQTEGDTVASNEEPGDTVSEANSAVHTIQAYRDVNGTTFLYLQPAPGEGGAQGQNPQYQPIVAGSETVTANGEIVSVAVQKDSVVLEGQAVDADPKTQEEATPRRLVHAPVKNFQGSSVPSRTVVRQMARPSPLQTSSSANSNSNGTKEDTYDAFGKYIASMLRNLPSKTACKLQGEIVNWILKEQMKNNDS